MRLDFSPAALQQRIKTRHLALLVALADSGNIHRAADMLAMTQPGASKLLRELEQSLGVSLFERLPRGVRPTAYGTALIRYARQVLDSLGKAGEELAALKDGQLGCVSVGCITSPSMDLLPEAVARIKRDWPEMRVSVEIESSKVLMERLAQDRLDLVLGRISADQDQLGLSYTPLSTEPVVAVVRPDHPLRAQTGLRLDDVGQSVWVIPAAGSVLRHQFELMFQRANLPLPTRLVETSAPLFSLRLLERSDMIAVLTKEVAQYCESRGLLARLPLAIACDMDDYGLISRTDRVLTPAVQRFHDLLLTLARQRDGSVCGAARAS